LRRSDDYFSLRQSDDYFSLRQSDGYGSWMAWIGVEIVDILGTRIRMKVNQSNGWKLD